MNRQSSRFGTNSAQYLDFLRYTSSSVWARNRRWRFRTLGPFAACGRVGLVVHEP